MSMVDGLFFDIYLIFWLSQPDFYWLLKKISNNFLDHLGERWEFPLWFETGSNFLVVLKIDGFQHFWKHHVVTKYAFNKKAKNGTYQSTFLTWSDIRALLGLLESVRIWIGRDWLSSNALNWSKYPMCEFYSSFFSYVKSISFISWALKVHEPLKKLNLRCWGISVLISITCLIWAQLSMALICQH